jgi:hypothetical protein
MAMEEKKELDKELCDKLEISYEKYEMSQREVVDALKTVNNEVPWDVPVEDAKLFPYLKPTVTCEAHHPEIKEVAMKIVEGAKDSCEAAMMVFYYMISEIKFEMAPPKQAMDAVTEKSGNCFVKAGLQIALLRSLGIPARYSFDKTLLKVIQVGIPKEIYMKMPLDWTIHQSADAYNIEEKRFIQCDSTFDQGLVPFPYNWNGRTDLLLLCPWWRLGHVGKSYFFPARELMERFVGRGFTKSFSAENINPFTEYLRTLSIQDLCKHYKSVLGRRDTDSFAHILYFHFVGYYRDVHYQPFFKYDIDWDGTTPVFKEPMYSTNIAQRSKQKIHEVKQVKPGEFTLEKSTETVPWIREVKKE